MREAVIERYLCEQVKAIGGIAYKFTSPAHRSVPDRLVLTKGLKVGVDFVDGTASFDPGIVFVELKAPGKKPTPGQLREHKRLRDLGFRVEVIDSKEGVDKFIRGL